MNHENCVAVISVFSEGGQLGQICSNSKIIQYFHPTQLQATEFDTNNKLYNIWLTSPNAFDFHCYTDCERYYYKNIENMLNDLNNII